MTDPKIPSGNLIKPNTNENADAADSSSGSVPVNLQKRKGEVEATRYGDWELNGRCIDF